MNNKNRAFADLGIGLFVHYGIYSVLGEGEWTKLAKGMNDEEYDKLATRFAPKPNFAKEICAFAKQNGFKYIVLTTRHHDGFSLYDTKGLNDFDSVHYLKRDLVKEFVDACHEYGIIPFLYHTLIDWREEKKHNSFSEYLEYLRNSVKLLCTNYGPIGGIWFDGQWKYPKADWEEDKMNNIIRKYQPNAVVTNNAGLSRLGERMSGYIDVVTFERSNISNYAYESTIDSYAAEMCQALNSHWGYAEDDINYKSLKEILYNLATSRKHGGNFLLNIGPMSDGSIRPIEKELINLLGKWINRNEEALHSPKPYQMNLPDNAFALKNDNDVYIFICDVPMEIDENAGRYDKNKTIINLEGLAVEKAIWLDTNENIEISNNSFEVPPYEYGRSWMIRIAKITKK